MSKKGFALPVILLLIAIIGFVGYLVWSKRLTVKPVEVTDSVSQLPLQQNKDLSPSITKADIPQVSIVATGLEVPWGLVFLPDGGMLLTERKGTVRLISKDGQLKSEPIANINKVKQIGEGGLLGIVLHPDFEINKFIYLYYTYSGEGNKTLNRVSRFTFDGSTLNDEKVLIEGIAGAPNHDGGRIKFGPDRMLYITTGDAQEPSLAQDTNSLSGKILRVTDAGDSAPGNPFGNRVFSYGHRNPQGITWDKNGALWQTEHGPSGLETGNDEFNKIEPGRNYGWPDIRGTQTKADMVAPILESGRGNTWAPAGLAYINESLYFAGLRGQALYEVKNADQTPKLVTHFKNEFGRLRDVIMGPDGMLYITTSNRDGRGSPKSGDDKVIRINPDKL